MGNKQYIVIEKRRNGNHLIWNHTSEKQIIDLAGECYAFRLHSRTENVFEGAKKAILDDRNTCEFLTIDQALKLFHNSKHTPYYEKLKVELEAALKVEL